MWAAQSEFVAEPTPGPGLAPAQQRSENKKEIGTN